MSNDDTEEHDEYSEDDDRFLEADGLDGADGQEEYEGESRRIPPKVLIASYLMVGAGATYVAIMFSKLGLAILIGWLFFPETFELWGTDPEIAKKIIDENPRSIMPTGLFYILLAATAVVCLAAGWLISRFARFAKLEHAIVLAVLLFVTYLQPAVTSHQDMKWMPLMLAGASSICVALGAKFQLGK